MMACVHPTGGRGLEWHRTHGLPRQCAACLALLPFLGRHTHRARGQCLLCLHFLPALRLSLLLLPPSLPLSCLIFLGQTHMWYRLAANACLQILFAPRLNIVSTSKHYWWAANIILPNAISSTLPVWPVAGCKFKLGRPEHSIWLLRTQMPWQCARVEQ